MLLQKAQLVLDGLSKDDDEVLAVWYLLGWLHYLTKDYTVAKSLLEKVATVRRIGLHCAWFGCWCLVDV